MAHSLQITMVVDGHSIRIPAYYKDNHSINPPRLFNAPAG